MQIRELISHLNQLHDSVFSAICLTFQLWGAWVVYRYHPQRPQIPEQGRHINDSFAASIDRGLSLQGIRAGYRWIYQSALDVDPSPESFLIAATIWASAAVYFRHRRCHHNQDRFLLLGLLSGVAVGFAGLATNIVPYHNIASFVPCFTILAQLLSWATQWIRGGSIGVPLADVDIKERLVDTQPGERE